MAAGDQKTFEHVVVEFKPDGKIAKVYGPVTDIMASMIHNTQENRVYGEGGRMEQARLTRVAAE